MIIEDVELNGINYGNALVSVGWYGNTGAMAIRLILAETREPLTTVTVNLPATPPREGSFWLRSWGENTGLLLLLGMKGLIEFEDPIRAVDINGYGSQALEVKPKGELKDFIDKEVEKWRKR